LKAFDAWELDAMRSLLLALQTDFLQRWFVIFHVVYVVVGLQVDVIVVQPACMIGSLLALLTLMVLPKTLHDSETRRISILEGSIERFEAVVAERRRRHHAGAEWGMVTSGRFLHDPPAKAEILLIEESLACTAKLPDGGLEMLQRGGKWRKQVTEDWSLQPDNSDEQKRRS
jgi:hypothetical protein